MLLRARVFLPVGSAPVEDGAVLLHGGRIAAVGRWAELRRRGARVCDLGEVVVLPGLINAHCHLDYTDFAGQIPSSRSFTEWIAGLVTLKSTWTPADYERSWARGAEMLLRSGTTTVVDIEAERTLLPSVWQETPLRIYSALEMINVRSRLPGGRLVSRTLRGLSNPSHRRCRLALSPHALYTASADVFAASARVAARRRMLVTSHVAESAAEYEMFMYRRGEMYDWLRRQRPMEDCGQGSPVAMLERLGVLNPRFLAVHVNYLWDFDAETLARRGVSVVHCPRCHSFFGHRRFPRQQLAGAGVNLCLGTDSLASIRRERGRLPELSMFAEMQAFAAANPAVPPAEILRMATINPARALGRAGELGELARGARADLIALPFSGSLAGVEEAVVQHRGDLAASMIQGRWALPPMP